MNPASKPRFIVSSVDPTQLEDCGGKVRALAALESIAAIPAWFALTPEAFTASALETETGFDLEHLTVSDAVNAELEAALTKLSPDGWAVAVRSSASDEDGAQHSFAGQLESKLNVALVNVRDAIVMVWRSAFSARLLEYRRTLGLGAASPPAVLVQRMVRADIAGVAFSADPVTGEAVTVIAAITGLGESLVSGERDGDTYRVAGEHVTAVATPEGDVLSHARALEVANLARRCEMHFAAPQDIEWAFQGEQLFLLQSRPITTIKRAASSSGISSSAASSLHTSSAGETGETVIWDNSNIIESYSGMTTPLTYSFARRAYGAVYRQFCGLLGVAPAKIADNAARFETMIGLIRGRIYYNLSNWYRLLALLPGFTLNRALMEQMMGVNEALPADLEREIAGQTGSKLRDALDLARAGLGLIASLVRLEAMKRAFFARLEAALKTEALSEKSLPELVIHYRQLEAQLITRWDAPLVNDFFAMVFYGLLRRIGERWLGDSDGSLQNALIVGGGGMISAEPAERLAALASLARSVPGLPALLCDANLLEIERELEQHTLLRDGARAYLERFGDRCLDELKLESATLTDEPLLLWRSVGQLGRLAVQTQRDDAPALAAERQRLEAEVGAKLSPLRRLAFDFVLAQARARVRDRENLRFERTRVFGRARRIFLEIGARLTKSGDLESERDVFWLEVGELLGLVEGTATLTGLRALVALRRAEFSAFGALPVPPRRFTTHGAVRAGSTLSGTSSEALLADDARRGIACSPGVVRGPVRVVTDPRTANLTGATIIVAERTDPGWILILPLARALLVERGSLLSHSAIVSRELGIPAIVALPGLMGWLRDGDWVELDGSSGAVRRIEPEIETELRA